MKQPRVSTKISARTAANTVKFRFLQEQFPRCYFVCACPAPGGAALAMGKLEFVARWQEREAVRESVADGSTNGIGPLSFFGTVSRGVD